MGDLYWGDNLEILRDYIPSASFVAGFRQQITRPTTKARCRAVDLIYLDPPFNSNRDYNVLFRDTGKVESEAQIEAFTDTWRWSADAEGWPRTSASTGYCIPS